MTAFVSWGIALATAVAPGAVSDVAYAARAIDRLEGLTDAALAIDEFHLH
jgi:hypothetical protein